MTKLASNILSITETRASSLRKRSEKRLEYVDHIHGVSNGTLKGYPRFQRLLTPHLYNLYNAKRDTFNSRSVMINKPNKSNPDVTLNTLVMLSRIALTFLTQRAKW